MARHFIENSEELRDKLVDFAEGKKELVVKRHFFIKGDENNDWDGVIDEFAMKLKDEVGDEIHDCFVSNFSTTTTVERVCSEVILMEAMSPFFDYILKTLCGIPAFFIAGTPDDWQSISSRLDIFMSLVESQDNAEIVRSWVHRVQEIIAEIRATVLDRDAATGNEEMSASRHTFWKNFYKWGAESGGYIISGWISDLFLYSREREGEDKPYWLRTQFGGGHTSLGFSQVPPAISSAPFLWKYLNEEFQMQFYGGMIGVSQHQQYGILRPEFAYVITEHTANENSNSAPK